LSILQNSIRPIKTKLSSAPLLEVQKIILIVTEKNIIVVVVGRRRCWID